MPLKEYKEKTTVYNQINCFGLSLVEQMQLLNILGMFGAAGSGKVKFLVGLDNKAENLITMLTETGSVIQLKTVR